MAIATYRYHPNYRHERASINWAQHVLKNKDKYVIYDCETTGLGKNDEVIEMAIIDLDGNVLLDQRIKPTKKKSIGKQASAIHGITMKDLKDCPIFVELKFVLEKILKNKKIITYNVKFDCRMYAQSFQLAGGYFHQEDWECAMMQYSRYVGQWNESTNDYRWQKLIGGDHTALGDCRATLKCLNKMAESKKRKYPFEFWVKI